MKNHAYARKRRQLQFLVKKLTRVLQQDHGKNEAGQLILKIKKLTAILKHVLQGFQLKKILAPAAFAFGAILPGQMTAQQFATPIENPFGLESSSVNYNFTALVDIDNDGDSDMFINELYGNIFYYQNTGTASVPEFAAPVPNPFDISTAAFEGVNILTFADLDADGDFDLYMGSYNEGDYSSSIHFFENTGTPENPQFGPAQANIFDIAPQVDFLDPNFVDLDNDGDLDLLTSAYLYYEEIAGFTYYENIGTASAPQFAAGQSNPFGLSSMSTYAFSEFADLDNDGDLDLLASNINGYGFAPGSFSYYENTGSATEPQFATPEENPFDLNFIDKTYILHQFADLDADGDLDILGQSYEIDTETTAFVYFENITSVSTKDLELDFALQLAPNPTNDIIHIQTDEVLQSVVLMDLQGRILKTFEQINSVSIKDFPVGMYYLKMTNVDGKYIVKKIQKH